MGELEDPADGRPECRAEGEDLGGDMELRGRRLRESGGVGERVRRS